jgi:hypothetical protein
MDSMIARVWRKIAGLPPLPATPAQSETQASPAPVATAVKTLWSLERDESTITIVVRDERGSLLGSHRMTNAEATRTAAQLWNLANFSMPEDVKPKTVATNDPNKIADAIFKAPAYATATPPKPTTKPLGPAFTVDTWPLGRIRKLIGRPVRFAFVGTDRKLRNAMGRILEVMPYGRRRMLTIETDIGQVMLFRNLEDVELFGDKELAYA